MKSGGGFDSIVLRTSRSQDDPTQLLSDLDDEEQLNALPAAFMPHRP
jgi:hypothetical protein